MTGGLSFSSAMKAGFHADVRDASFGAQTFHAVARVIRAALWYGSPRW